MLRSLRMLAAPLLLVAAVGCGAHREVRHMLSDQDNPAFADIGHDVRSPSGRYTLTVAKAGRRDGVERVSVTVLDGDRHPVYEDPSRYSINHTTLVLWADRADQVWVYSGDIGTFLALPQPGGGWAKKQWVDLGRPTAPTALRKARPTAFP